MSAGERVRTSAYMITYNNARTVERALRSVSWADEVVVIDSFSDDGTLDIARRYAQTVEQREWPGFRDQYQYAADLCSHDWVFFADADEEVSAALAAEMQEALSRNARRPDSERISGYHGHRRTYYLGRWIMHGGWVPDHEIRLYRRDRGRWEGGLHANIHVDGLTADLRNFYYHYTYAGISDQLKTIDKYSDTAARDLAEAGKKPSLLRMCTSPPFRFFRDYVLKGGFRDGVPGLIIAVNTMFHVFVKQAKLWERHPGRDSAPDTATDHP